MNDSSNPMLEGHGVFIPWTGGDVPFSNEVEPLAFHVWRKGIGAFDNRVNDGFVNFFCVFKE